MARNRVRNNTNQFQTANVKGSSGEQEVLQDHGHLKVEENLDYIDTDLNNFKS